MRVRRSLTIKQMAMVAAVCVAFIFVFIVIQLFHFVQQNRYFTAMQMESVARSVRNPLSTAILKADIPQAEAILKSIQPGGVISRADVVLPNQFQALRVSFMSERPVPVLMARLFEIPVQITLPLYSLERPANPQPLAYLVLQADSWRMYKYVVSTISTLVTTWLLMALVLTVAISWCVNRLMVHPLRRIIREIEALEPQAAVEQPLSVSRLHKDDEIGILIRHYNRAWQRLNSTSACVPSAQRALAERRLQEEREIARSLERGDFALWLQPQVDLRTGKVTGAEALLRQRQVSGDWALPDGLIERIERCGLMVPVVNWILEEACRTLAEWQRRGIALTLSVNLSALQLLHPELAPVLLEMLSRYRLSAGSLTLEITESRPLDEGQLALNILRPLHQAGVRIALDDFGKGYASLHQLYRMRAVPMDILKIDKAFIDPLPVDDSMASVILTLARRLGLEVVAEGIETQTQREWLCQAGAHIGQGFLFDAALPPALFAESYLSASDSVRL